MITISSPGPSLAIRVLGLDNELSIVSVSDDCWGKKMKVRLKQILPYKRKYNSFEIIYLAFHGSKNKILIGHKAYSLEKFAKTFEGRLDHKMIHFGSCKTLSVNE